MNRNIPKLLAILIILLVIAVIIGIALWFCPEKETFSLQDETTDWQTYRNEEYGFKIKYPEDFITLETEGLVIVSFCGGEAASFCGIKGASYHPEICLFKFKKDGLQKNVYDFIFGNGQFSDSNFWPFGKDPKTTNCNVTSIDVDGASGKLWVCDYETGYGEIDAFWDSPQDNSFYIMDVSMGNEFPSVKTVFNQILSTFRFIENDDDLLHKLFPNLEFNNGQAITLGDSQYGGMGLNLFLEKKVEDYFIDKDEKSLLLIVALKGVAHAGGLYHSYLGLFDLDGNILTPFSSFPEPNLENDYGDDRYDFFIDEAQFGGDQGEFGFYDCNGIKYVLFVSHGCPNGTCCDGIARLFRIDNGTFEEVQIINAEINASYALRITLLDNKILIDKVPQISDGVCAKTAYKELKWNENSCRFE